MKSLIFLMFLTFTNAYSSDWVRLFNDGTNHWTPSQLQSFNLNDFRKCNWPHFYKHDCAGDEAEECPIKETLPKSLKAKRVFDQLEKLELTSFSEDVKNCVAAGELVSAGTSSSQCCTGMINPISNRCQLADFNDVSVYTNKTISSASKKLSAFDFDSDGYIRDQKKLEKLICDKKLCASGTFAYGVLISRLRIPGLENTNARISRFLENSIVADDANGIMTLFLQGLKLNTHAYCISSNINSGDDVKVVRCSK